MELHVLLAGVEFGPYTDDKARELLGEGFLSSTDPAKRLNATDWVPLSDLLGVAPTSATTLTSSGSLPPSFSSFFTEETQAGEPEATPAGTEDTATPEETEPATEQEAESYEEESAAEPVEVAEEKPEPVVLPPPIAFADTKRVKPATSTLSTYNRPPTQPIPAPDEIKTSFVKALAATRSMAGPTSTKGVTPPLQSSIPARPANLPPPPLLSEAELPPEIPAPAVTPQPAPRLQVSNPTSFIELRSPSKVSTPPRAASVTPLLNVSVPARGAKKTTVTGSLLAKEALHAARDRSGILPPTRQVLGRVQAPVPEFEPEPPPPRKRTPLILGNDREEPTPQPQRKAIRLTGRIALPGTPSQTDRLVSPAPTANTGIGMVARLSKAEIEPAAEVKSAPLQLRERKDPNLLKPQVRKVIRLTGPISLPGRATQPTPPAMPITEAKTPTLVAPPVEWKAPTEETPAEPEPAITPEDAKAPVEDVQPEPAPAAIASPVEPASPMPEIERTAELAATAALAAEIFESKPKETDLTASGSLSGTGQLLSTGDLAERRSLKVTGALRHMLPPRQPVQLSSSSGDSGRQPLPGEDRAAAAMLPPAFEPEKYPAPPVPEEDLPNRPPTGKIAVSEMPTEGVKIRRRLTTKIPLPATPTESLAHESPARRLPPPLPRREEPAPAPIAAPAEPVASALPVAETIAEVAAPVLAAASVIDAAPVVEPTAPPAEETASSPYTAYIPKEEDVVATPVEEPIETTPAPAFDPAPVAAKPEKVRLRRPVKLELSSRAKIQDSGRLTLEDFSKMASLELPKATPMPVAPAAGAENMTTEPESEMPAEIPSIEPFGVEPEAAQDFSAPQLAEATPVAWRPTRPKKGDRSIVWIAYTIIALGLASAIILYVVHRNASYQGAPPPDESAPAPSTPAATEPATPVTPPPSASPPSASPGEAPPVTPPSSTPPSASVPAATTPVPPATSPAPATAPATPPATTSTISPAQDIQRQASAFVSDGILRYQRGDFDGAIAAYNQAIDLDPKAGEAFFNRGIAKAAHDDLDGAIADYSQALQVDPTLSAAYYYRGLARHSKGDLDGAIGDYNQAVQIDPKNAFAFFNRGLIRMQKDDIDGAVTDSTRALELDPKMIQSYYDRGLGRLAKGAVDGALSDMKTFCQQAPQDGYTDYARLYIWLIQTQQGQLAEANQELTAAMNGGWNGKPDDMVTRIGEYLLGQIGENDLVKASASSIPVKDQGQRCEAWYFIGMRKLEAGDKDAAIDALQKCIATQKIDYCEYILAQEELKSISGNAAPAPPRAQSVSLPDPGTMAPPSAPAPQ
jgi:lipoprotein NlpI